MIKLNFSVNVIRISCELVYVIRVRCGFMLYVFGVGLCYTCSVLVYVTRVRCWFMLFMFGVGLCYTCSVLIYVIRVRCRTKIESLIQYFKFVDIQKKVY